MIGGLVSREGARPAVPQACKGANTRLSIYFKWLIAIHARP